MRAVSSGNCLCILIWSFLLISIQSLPLAANGTRVEEKCQPTSQSFLDSSPFFRMAPSRFQSQQILFLTEFSRFMNRHAPTMMKEFVGKKQIYQAERTLQKLKRYNPETALNELDGSEVEARTMAPLEEAELQPVLTRNQEALLMPRENRSMVSSITDSRLADPEAYETTNQFFLSATFDAIDSAKEIVTAVEHSRDKHDFISPDFWAIACKSEWWPFDDRTCMEVRCTACAPSILSAGAVCDVYKKDLNTIISFRCMQRVMGEGFCNFCIPEYIEKMES